MATLINKPVSRETNTEVTMVSGKPRKLVVTIDREHLELREKGTRQSPIRVSYHKLYMREVQEAARRAAGL